MGIQVDFTDSDESKWGEIINDNKVIILPSNVIVEEYLCCLICSEKCEVEIEDIILRLGFKKNQIISTQYIIAQKSRFRKIYYIPEWAKRNCTNNIDIIKSWYVNGDDLETIIKIQNAWNYNFIIDVLIPGNEKYISIIDFTTEKEVAKTVKSGDRIELFLEKDTTILKIKVTNELYEIPWLFFFFNKIRFNICCRKRKTLYEF